MQNVFLSLFSHLFFVVIKIRNFKYFNEIKFGKLSHKKLRHLSEENKKSVPTQIFK